jgi:hypothetical protein
MTADEEYQMWSDSIDWSLPQFQEGGYANWLLPTKYGGQSITEGLEPIPNDRIVEVGIIATVLYLSVGA